MKKLRIILFISLFVFSCQNDEITKVKLNDFSKLFTVSKDNIVEIVSNSEFNNIIEYLNCFILFATSPSPVNHQSR